LHRTEHDREKSDNQRSTIRRHEPHALFLPPPIWKTRCKLTPESSDPQKAYLYALTGGG